MDLIKNYSKGKYVIVRTYSAGVHMGLVEDINKAQIILSDTRRMRKFVCLDDGDSLSHIALNGISPESAITAAIPSILLQWIEVIPLSERALQTFMAQPYEKVRWVFISSLFY